MADVERGGRIPELVTFTEIARRVTEQKLVPRSITRQGVRHIADTDPAWPVPQSEWLKIGTAWAMPWEPVEKFFRARTTRGRGPAANKESGERNE